MFFSALVVLGLAAQALAQDPDFDIINKPAKDEYVPAGETYTIEWALGTNNYSGPATITLLGGSDSTTLSPLGVIGYVDNSALAFQWDVDASLGSDNLYGISITLDANTEHFQYSPGFHISKANNTSSSTVSSESTSSTASSASSASSAASSSSAVVTSSSVNATATSTAETIETAASSSSTASASQNTTLATATHTATSTASSTSSSASSTATVITSAAGRFSLSGLSTVVLATLVGATMQMF